MVCWGIERGFIIQMAIIKQNKTFLERFGSIGPMKGGKGYRKKNMSLHLIS